MATQTPSSSTNSEDAKKRKRDNSSCSEEDEKIITSSSPSSSTPRCKHDVFLSFCGKDTRRSFTDHLYFDLKRKGILVFRDDESLERGKCISQELPQAIQESQYAIVIFSANYASSKWCLRELAEIVEWEEKKNLKIIPIFYHVNPSDVRNKRGNFAEAFAAHEKDLKVDIKEIDTWRNACRKVGNISGEHINANRNESTIIQQISGMIFYNYTMLNILFHYDGQKLVGINSRVENMINLLDMESNDVRFLGIHGMGGVGKTTLAEIIYYRVSCQFEGSSFISCIRERSTTTPDLASLQKQLLSMIMQQEIHIWDYREGIMLMSTRLRNKKVLIILDDVDCEKQLTALAGNQKWFGPGSRVIITCRDSHTLITHGVNDTYKVVLLPTADALQLFSLSAFDKTNPPENYKDLSMDFVSYAGGLPLALKVLGRFLFGRTIDLWKSARDKLEAISKTEIFDILKISFDGLEESQKKLFLDLACFCYIRFSEERYLAIDFEVLVDRSLVSPMHDLLKKMGQEIVRREDPEEPGRRSRLCRKEDVFHVLQKDTGTDAIESIYLHFVLRDEAKHRFNMNAKAFSKMRKLRFLSFELRFLRFEHFQSYINWRGNPLKYMPSDKLQFLNWHNCPPKSWPSSFQPKGLVVLRMPRSSFKRLWKGLMILDNLKILDLNCSYSLIETPDLSGAPKLEEINLTNCSSLCEVHPSIGTLRRLQVIEMPCTGIKQLWKGMLVVLDNLKQLDLSGCDDLIEIPDLSRALNLEIINFSDCESLCKVHQSIGFLKRLKHLSLDGCSRLGNFLNIMGDMISQEISLKSLRLPSSEVSIFPSVIYSFSSLEILWLDGWPSLEKFPDLSRLKSLKEFQAYETAITQIPSVNLLPKSIGSFELEGEKRMPRESRDLVMFINDCSLPKQSSYPTNRDIGSPVEYETERVHIRYDDDGLGVSITRCSLGSTIPEWVHNKSNGSSLFFDMCNGSSLKIESVGDTESDGDTMSDGDTESDGDTMSVMGIAIFIVCQFHLIPPVDFRGYERVAFPICLDDGTPEKPFCKFLFALSTDVILDKQIVLWQYLWDPVDLESWKLKSLDKRKISTIAKFEQFADQTSFMGVEVKEWGLHLVCPDDHGALGLGSDLDSLVNFLNLPSEMRHDEK
ncbi:disease resistance protein RPV1-like [Carya illinoinensis]|uniref:disease resistance protein RPV1-like n=1 Tax=Carya illinoinensis TaxID=32201 RepID=UPI001C726755|nr:disease resistance protein RPV1-like [Carya illinoinensis]XP_042959100.1 disease resistance protein RPV1-like [Carya illinoinensis]